METDHQPLVTILKKPIHAAPACLQRMLLSLQGYDINLVYKKASICIWQTLFPDLQIHKSPKAQQRAMLLN